MTLRRPGIVATTVLSCYLLCGWDSPQTCNDPPPSHTGAEVAGVAIVAGVVIGTIVLVHVHHKHHRVEGCVYNGPNGLEVRERGDSPLSWRITGQIDDLKPGEVVKLEGDRVKQPKGSTEDQQFVVDNIRKIDKKITNCQVALTPSTPAAASTTTM